MTEEEKRKPHNKPSPLAIAKRTTQASSKMNADDLIVTVALSSILATSITSKDVALAEGLLVTGFLIILQLTVTWFSVRSATVQSLAHGEPAFLFSHRAAAYSRSTRRSTSFPPIVRVTMWCEFFPIVCRKS